MHMSCVFIYFVMIGHAIAQVVNQWLHTLEAWVHFLDVHVGFRADNGMM
jgi:hypothetical protein